MSTVKNPETQVRRPDESLFKRLTRQQLFIPVAALVLLVLFNLIADPSFFMVSIKENSLGNPVLSGNIVSVLDNLLKGASGQAVQNMNLMFGLDETAGLRLKANAF